MEKMVLPIRIKSRNQIDRLHWGAKARLKDKYTYMVAKQMQELEIRKAKEKEKFRIEIISYRKRLLDYDNLDLKLILDACVRNKLIWDDAPEFIHRPLKEQIRDKEERTEIIRHPFDKELDAGNN